MVFRDIVARRHGNDKIFAFLVFDFGDAKNHFVLVNAKFRGFPDGQENGMLIVFWPNAVNDAVGFEDIFLTEDFLRVFVLAVGAKDLACDGLAIFFGVAAGGGIHLQERAFFEDRLILGFGSGGQCEKQSRDGDAFHVRSFRVAVWAHFTSEALNWARELAIRKIKGKEEGEKYRLLTC